MFNRIGKYSFFTVGSLLLGLTLCGCSDEVIDVPDYTVSGAEVTLKVPVSLPSMDVKSRSSLDANQLNQVESLWVRTYSARTGEATSSWVKTTTASSDAEVSRTVEIPTRSGSSYIVAVANVDNLGVTADDISTQRPLSELLEEADTWGDFLKIAVVAPVTQQAVRAPLPPLPMAGCYTDLVVGGAHPEPSRIDEWQKRDFTPYFIPSQEAPVTFTGAIHLRRLVSHINFNFIPGDDVDVTVNSYQVMNAPRFSWLYERPGEDGLATNFGDLAESEEDAGNYYASVPQFTSQNVTQGEDGVQKFDFWQSENKHSGTATTYKDRDNKSAENPTLFTSLTGDTWTANNEASYVIVTCTVDYKDKVKVDGNGNSSDTGDEMYRVGEAIYIIHLGYVGTGLENDKAKDYNCFRNVDYTYNVKVNGVDDIRVDAFATDEMNSGEEGYVVDILNPVISVDAHYAAFNIQLTEDELRSPDFGFLIATYDNGRQILLSDANDQAQINSSIVIYADKAHTQVIDEKYYNWIELRPTSGANTLAEYKPRYGGNADGKTFLLTDLWKGWTSLSDNCKSASGYYTVFVNEYTYENIYTGTDGYANETWNGTGGRPQWTRYVNQNPRRFYFLTGQTVSADGNSIYARSKYGVSQQSLMTYYSDQTFAPAQGTAIPAGTAIAVERINENMGLNVRHTFVGGTSIDNGRWNTAQYLNGSSTATENLSISSANETSRPEWSAFVQTAVPMEVPEVESNRLQGGAPIPGRTIAGGNPHTIPALVVESGGAAPNFTDPQSSATYTFQAINACMSRNRDNNGNGRIEPDELRWYVPALKRYLDLMFSSNALPEALMNYSSIARLPYVSNGSFSETSGSIVNDYCSRYMFVGSNSSESGNVLWGMEGTSVSPYEIITTWAGVGINPWQIRCVRNLGSDMSSVVSEEKVSAPYVHDTANRTIRLSYLNLSAIRTIKFQGNGTAAGYVPVHTLNTMYNTMYYAFQYAPNDIVVPADSRPNNDSNSFLSTYGKLQTYINGNPCGSEDLGFTGTGWRLPNQEELNMMHTYGVLTHTNPNATWLSSTVNYFNHSNGVGSDDTANKYYLVMTTNQATQLTLRNFGDAVSQGFFIRCVRDVD